MDQSIFDQLPAPIVPVLVLEDSTKAQQVGMAFMQSGLPILEVTLRTKSAWDSIARLQEISGLSVGVGSITSLAQLQKAIAMKVSFMVSPGFDEVLVEEALRHEVPYLPGVANPSDLMRAQRFNLTTLKFFPAETLGGVKAIKAMSAPFPNFKFIPTGGITDKNVKDYLKEKNIPAVGGSWMISQEAIDGNDFSQLSADISQALASTL